jgi:hypothetical protein
VTFSTVVSGLWIGLAVILIVAGFAKARAENPFVVQVGRLLPQTVWRRGIKPRALARVVWIAETAAGIAMLATASHPLVGLAALAAAIFIGLLAVTLVLRRRGLPCGCFGKLTPGVPQRADVWRSICLLLASVISLAWTASGPGALHGKQLAQAVSVALVFGLITFGPLLLMRFTQRISWREPFASADGSVVEAETRRGFLVRAAAGVAVLAGSGLIAQTAAASTGPPDCMAYYIECGACCGMNQTCAACCSGCYYFCRFFSGGTCMATCNGCWPG